jgi:hypothetical protein
MAKRECSRRWAMLFEMFKPCDGCDSGRTMVRRYRSSYRDCDPAILPRDGAHGLVVDAIRLLEVDARQFPRRLPGWRLLHVRAGGAAQRYPSNGCQRNGASDGERALCRRHRRRVRDRCATAPALASACHWRAPAARESVRSAAGACRRATHGRRAAWTTGGRRQRRHDLHPGQLCPALASDPNRGDALRSGPCGNRARTRHPSVAGAPRDAGASADSSSSVSLGQAET